MTGEPEGLTQARYSEILSQIVAIGELAAVGLISPSSGPVKFGPITDEELAAFVEWGEHALAIGPYVDPTLFQRGGQRARQAIALARALIEFRRAVWAVRTIT